jgi:myosin heavy subunit
LSTLTKVLIVLQVVVALVLCGLVVSYVATADNYKQMYETERSKASRAIQEKDNAQEEFEKFKADKDQELAQLTKQMGELKDTISRLNNDLAVSERTKAQLGNESLAKDATIQTANTLAKQQGELYAKAKEQLNDLRDEQAKRDGQLREINDTLIEKMGIITTQTEQIKRLMEEKTELQAKLEQSLRQFGKALVPPIPAQPQPTVQQARPLAKDIDLKGVVTKVDLEHKLAEISIGSAHGVRQDMKFYVTRGDQFVCNILVLEVEADKTVGILDLVQTTPLVGDVVSTNL